MIPDNVTLIVKAPNQQIEDQNIECQSSWTVLELKGHLSEVYPSKPRTDEQKIIYSGQLLENNTVLKDVLRTYDSQIAHTMHLVCTPKRRIQQTIPKESPPPPTDQTEGLRHRNVPTETTNATPAPPAPPTPQTENVTRPETRQNDQNHTVEMQNYLTSFVNNYGRVPPYPNYSLAEGYLPVPNDPASMANHVAMMQQAYLQYMQQYANMWQAGNPPAAEATPPPAPEAPAAPPEDAEEGMAARDWLDHVYSASRLAILVSLVYLYGSPARLLLVVLIAAAGYLHQIGFFRDLHVNPLNNVNANARPNANPRGQPNANPRGQPNANPRGQPNANPRGRPNARVQPNANPNGNEPNRAPPNNADATDNVTSATDNPADVNNAAVNHDNEQSLLAFTWMIFSSFFASLIPDTN